MYLKIYQKYNNITSNFFFHKINVNIVTDGQGLRVAKIKNYY